MNRRQKIIVSVTGIFLVLLLLVGLTYAYFLTRITGNTNDKSISVSTANLAIVYGNDDGSVIGSGEKITPGTTFEPKTFTVTNNGNANTDYVVVIEDASVTYAETIEVDGVTQTKDAPTTFESNDFTYTLTCEAGCNSVQEPTTFPIEGGILVGNRLDVGETQTYSFTLTYNETGENQSNDMNKKLEAKINIKDITTINPYSDKPNTLAYNIINNAVALTNEEKSLGYAELVGAPYSKVATEINKAVGTANFKSAPVPNVTYDWSYADTKEGAETGIDVNKCTDELIGKWLYDKTDFFYEEVDLIKVTGCYGDIPMYDAEILSGESVLSTTQDEYGTSYYYRGTVKNNYVNFNRMCWRIVRIEGDGSVRMILADKDAECSENTLNKYDSSIIAKGNYAYSGGFRVSGREYSYDYIPPSIDDRGKTPYDPAVQTRYTWHLKQIYNTFLNGGTIEYTVDGSYKGDGTDVIITQEYAGFSEENLDLMQSKKVCIGDRSNTYAYPGFTSYYNYYSTIKRLYEDKYATLLCNDGDYIELSKIFPLTIDEVIFAGGVIDSLDSYNPGTSNYSYYLRENAMADWWLLSYSGILWNSSDLAFIGYISIANERIMVVTNRDEFKGIRPVISLIPNVELTSGDGTVSNPYVIG